MDSQMSYTVHDYQKQKPFSSFLSGIAGIHGIPLWSFYVNRGQLIAGFGVRDKNGAIMEFFPANNAYHHVPRIGFRTFVKIDGQTVEWFKEGRPGQTLIVRPDQVAIEETDPEMGIRVKVTYFTLPNEPLAALVRKVEIFRSRPCSLELVDGLAQILPSGVDYGGYKAVSNLLQSWMSSDHEDGFVFYKLRASTADSSEVAEVKDGNFFLTVSSRPPLMISDYKLVFDEDTSLETPYGFLQSSLSELGEVSQTHVNQVPSAMCGLAFPVGSQETFYSLIGYSPDKTTVADFLRRVDVAYLQGKETENARIHEELMEGVGTRTAEPILDAYFRQCYLDNVLRGGKPLLFETAEGPVGYHVFSRKHGDLERDYNFFTLEPSFYSQGNGNFRDVLQNRRNDLFFEPRLGDANITQFASFLQADGYNPLSIEGIRFSFVGDRDSLPSVLKDLPLDSFTPGMVATALQRARLPAEPALENLIAKSRVEFRAAYGEGYWEDHFTYFLDLIETFLAVYPDREATLLFDKTHPFFRSPVAVRPRSEKYVIRKDGSVRQYGSLRHKKEDHGGWLQGSDGPLKANLAGKLLVLVLNKFGHLDPEGIGLSYEADRPGWNDAMNGLPGLFGSGVSEAIELRNIVSYLLEVLRAHPDRTVILPDLAVELAEAFQKIPIGDHPFVQWDARMTALEAFRDGLEAKTPKAVSVSANRYLPLLETIMTLLDRGLAKAKSLGEILPTYLTFEATSHLPILDSDGKPKIGDYGLPLTRVTGFSMKPLPLFLEAPARLLQSGIPDDEARSMIAAVRRSGLFDEKQRFYQTSVSLETQSHEIGRIRAFTPGWLERESNFLHMTYKYLLGMLKSRQYETFFSEMRTNFPCFMDPAKYGRSPLENCSFLATSSNPDPKKRGQGFVARLSGSTAEALSMWRMLFFGPKPFRMEAGTLVFAPTPILPRSLFREGLIEVLLFGKTLVRYHADRPLDTYDPEIGIERMTVEGPEGIREFRGSRITDWSAQDIRAGKVFSINVYFKHFLRRENNE